MRSATHRILPVLCMAIALICLSGAAHADAFIPTMISADVLWLFVFPVIVILEGWLMARQKWQAPYMSALKGNILSFLAALPLEILLHSIGGYISSPDGRSTFAFIPEKSRFILSQILTYGQLPGPGMSGVYLAAIVFMGICWAFSIVVEGYYYSLKNPSLPTKDVFKTTAVVHIASYLVLFLLWFPYCYYGTR